MRWLALHAFFATILIAQQVVTGTLSGTITDEDGHTVPRIAVQATNVTTKVVYRATASATGEYSIPQLPSGIYQVTTQASLIAFKPFVKDNLRITPGQTFNLDIRLDEGVALNTLGDGRAYAAALPRHDPPTGPTTRMADGKPDLSGFWSTRGASSDLATPDFEDSALVIAKSRATDDFKDAPSARCVPNGIVWTIGGGGSQRFVQSPGMLVMFSEGQLPRQIFLDGRNHPSDPNPTWQGHSIGRWDGDTLVVDSVGFNDQPWLDLDGHPQTETMHLVERYRRPDLGHMELELTIEEPGTLKKPWIIKRIYNLDPKDDVLEYVCNENERDSAHLNNK